MATNAETLELVDGLAKILTRRNCDLVDVDPETGRIKIVKSMHEMTSPSDARKSGDDDELAEWSSEDA